VGPKGSVLLFLSDFKEESDGDAATGLSAKLLIPDLGRRS
jgi:hypothetical protein